jgi:hypothetical protein
MSYNNVGHVITCTIITLQHIATLHHTSPNFTPLHLSTLHFLSFTLHYPLIWLNPFTFPIPYCSISPHTIKIDTVQFSHLQTYFQNNEPLHCPKEPLTISLHFFFFFLFTYHINPSLHFTLLFTSTTRFPSLHFPSLFTFYRLHFPHCFTLS